MTRFEWLCVLAICCLLAGLVWLAPRGWPQEAPDDGLEDRLYRLELKLDRLLEDAPAAPVPKRAPRRAKPSPVPPLSDLFQPVPHPVEPAPLAPAPPPPAVTPPCVRCWTWEEIDAAQVLRALTLGD